MLKPVDLDDPPEGFAPMAADWGSGLGQRTGAADWLAQVTAISVMVPLSPDVPWICVSTSRPMSLVLPASRTRTMS